MFTIEFQEHLDTELEKIIDSEFNSYADKNNLVCGYSPFCFVARNNGTIIGVLTGYAYYKEAHISDLIVLEKYRNQRIGSLLLKAAENYYKDKGIENINLSTYEFQAPAFYKKNGFQVEFIRKNTENPKLTKYFFIKRFDV